MNEINRHYKDVKRVIRKQLFAEPYFVSKYSFSPYMACEHACKYCDGRAEKYYVQGDYEKDIIIRENLPDILKIELSKLREKGIIFIGSGISDAYQPVEESEKIMRRSARIILNSKFSAAVLTKSSLICRDLDIWKQVNEKNGFTLMISLITLNDDHRKIFEPNASSVQERLHTLKLFKNNGIPVGVMAMPFLPLINDSHDQMKLLIEKVIDAGADFIFPGCLTLRPGNQKKVYFDIITKHFPRLISRYNELYGKELISGNPSYSYRNDFYKMTGRILQQKKILERIPHKIYKDRFSICDEIFILLDHMQHLYHKNKIDTDTLKSASRKYHEWLMKERKIFNRRRNLSEDHLDRQLISLMENGEFEKIINNRKLDKFLKRIVLDRNIFDYNKLKLIN